MKVDLESRIERVTESGCWLWVGSDGPKGYGRIMVAQKAYRAHRFVYEAMVGPIPQGLVIDHLCRVRCCVNPAHMRTVSNKANVLAGVGVTALNAQKEVCKRGHPLSGANIKIAGGYRNCRICVNLKARARKAAKRKDMKEKLYRGWTRKQIEFHILQDANGLKERPDQCLDAEGWFKPLAVGGWDAGPHSSILHKFAKLGFVEMRWWGRARAYRLTDKGVEEYNKLRAIKGKGES